jgi:hypothetical protein
MDPITLIVTALAAGAAAAAKDVGGDAVKSAFNGLKALIAQKFGGKPDVVEAVDKVEQKPESEGRKETLKEELQAAGADKDQELLTQVQAFLKLLEEKGVSTGVSQSIGTATATASGEGSTAVGAIQVGGNAGPINIGTKTTNRSGGVDISPSGGNVTITGDVVGRDKKTGSR